MANVKITDLTAYTNPASTDVLPIVDVGADITKKVSIADLLENAGSGTAAAPGIAFDGDPDTGIYRPGANQVAISTNGTGRLFVTSAGKVLIGSAADQGTGNLQVSGTGRIGSFDFGNTANELTYVTGANMGIGTFYNNSLYFKTANTERMRLDSSGRLGLGTSSPEELLHISSSNSGGNFVGQIIQNTANPAAPNTSVELKLRLSADAPDKKYAGIKAIGTANYNNKIDLAFFTLNGTSGLPTSNEERVRITGDGKVGIGDTGPSETLTVKGASSVDPFSVSGPSSEFLRVDDDGRLLVGTSTTSTNTNTKLVIEKNNAPRTSGNPEAGLFITTSSTGGYALQAGAYNSGSLSTSYTWISSVRSNDAFDDGSNLPPLAFLIGHSECMRINGGKELLIGYTSDNGAYKLQVNSQIFATSATIATSDGRYKENVTSLVGCLDLVKALRPVSFTWKQQQDITRTDDDGNEVLVREGHNFPKGTQVGFIAQEVQEVLADKPWLGSVIKENVRPAAKDDEGNELAPEEQFFGIAEGNLIAVLTNALQEAVAEIESLKSRLDAANL